eukprot:1145590-Pelagomonas_calceolata.AAC.1
MSASGGQKWYKHGNQASTVFGHNLSARTCSACFLDMPASFGCPGIQGVALCLPATAGGLIKVLCFGQPA